MKGSRFSEQRGAVALLQDEAEMPVGGVCRKMGTATRPAGRWKKRYGVPIPPEVHRLKQPKEENIRLRPVARLLTADVGAL